MAIRNKKLKKNRSQTKTGPRAKRKILWLRSSMNSGCRRRQEGLLLLMHLASHLKCDIRYALKDYLCR